VGDGFAWLVYHNRKTLRGLGQLTLFRVIQGLAGGGLQPSSQGVLLDAFPVEGYWPLSWSRLCSLCS
jgi:MFS family permease